MSIIGVILEQGSGVPDAGVGFAETWTKLLFWWTTLDHPFATVDHDSERTNDYRQKISDFGVVVERIEEPLSGVLAGPRLLDLVAPTLFSGSALRGADSGP